MRRFRSPFAFVLMLLLAGAALAKAPTVKLDPRYGKSTFTVDSSKPGRLVVDFKSPDSSFNSIPGTIVAISLPISPSASIGASSPFTLDPAGTYLLTRKGRKVRRALQNGTISIQ